MAEDVIIRGFGDDREFPDFATEKTIKTVEAALKQANVFNSESTKYLAQVALGEKRGQMAMNKLIQSMNSVSSEIKTGTSKQNDAAESADQASKKQLGAFTKLLTLGKETIKLRKEQFAKELKNDDEIKRLMKQGMAEDSAGLMAGLSSMTGIAGKLAAGVVAVAGVVKGANNYLLQQGTDRFNFAQELRQSGLAAGLSESGASLTAFADKVRMNNFTLGEAAEFTQRFSKAVGVTGVNGAMDFVNTLAYSGENGGDMMRRFGMEFGEVANVSGEYLESVRNLGMLDKMSNNELRLGMDNFMSTVVATSNIMKINMEDAAQMIKDTLGRDDITSLLATMDPRQAAQVQDVVGLAGGMQSELGEALAQRLAAGSQQEFMMSDAYRQLQSSPIAMELLPVIERLALASEQGGTEGFQNVFSNLSSDIERIRGIASDNRVLFTSGADDTGMKVLAQLVRRSQTAEDANAGFVKLGEDDTAALGSIEVQRQFTVAMEGVNNELIKSGNFGENVAKLNRANLALIETLEAEATGVANQVSGIIFDTTFAAQAGVTTIINGFVGQVADIARGVGLLDSEAGKAADAVRAMRQSINATFGGSAVFDINGELASGPIGDLVSKISNNETELSNLGPDANPFARSGLTAALQNDRLKLEELISEVESTNPTAANLLRIEAGLNNLAQEGQTVQYDPARLALEQKMMMTSHGYIGQQDSEGYVLQGGGRMETRQQASERVLASLEASLGTSMNNDTFSALRSGNSTDLLRQLGFDDESNDIDNAETRMVSDMILAMNEANILSREKVQELIEAMRNTTGSEGLMDFSAASEAEKAERDKLITAISTLVTQLRE